MPAIRPSSTIATRSQIARSSSSSLETMTMVVPYSRLYAQQGVQDQLLGPHVDSAGGLGHEQEARLDREGPGQADLLLVAARQLLGLLAGALALDVQHAHVFLRELFSCPVRRAPSAGPREAGAGTARRICMAVKARFQSRPSSSSRPTPRRSSDTKAMPSCRTSRGEPMGHFLPVEADRPAGGEQAHDPVGDAELALAGQAADAEDLPFAHGEAHVPDRLPRHVHPEVLHG